MVPPGTRRRLASDDRMAEIVDVAAQLIARHGFHGITVQQVAEACGMSQAGLLHHVKNKDGILVAVLAARDLDDVKVALADSAPNPQDDPRAFLHAVVAHNAQQPEIVRLYAVLAAESLEPDHPAHAYFTHRYDDSIRRIAAILEGWVPDPRWTATLSIAVMDGLQLQWLRNEAVTDLVAGWERFEPLIFGPDYDRLLAEHTAGDNST